MNIDKTRFLLLTTTLAAAAAAALVTTSGCTVVSNNTNTTPDGGTPAASDSGGGGSVDAGPTSEGGDAGGCLADNGSAPACTEGDGGTKCYDDCTRFGGEFKKEVATEIMKCLSTEAVCKPAGETCANKTLEKVCDDPAATTFCQTEFAACSDAGALTDGGVSAQKACEKFARAMTSEGRKQLKDCFVDQGGACTGTALNDCLEGSTYQGD